ncbi:MAG: hypothetical protein NZL85_10565 [Fimbriimonadales bacterium]|nr:hypothetical protein [Fimbriimonadales bacterium]
MDYLLSTAHPYGRYKAQVFLRYGFSPDQWEILAAALLEHAQKHDVARIESTPFGTRYCVDGNLATPSGRELRLRVVWFIETGSQRPRLVTAYPIRKHSG